MSNIILNSLHLNNLHFKETKAVILKPLTDSGNKISAGIMTGDSLLRSFSAPSYNLMNPLQLFQSEKPVPVKGANHGVIQLSPLPGLTTEKNNSTAGHSVNKNMTITEPGVSIESINALKQIPGRQWLGKLASNGNREAAIIIPEGANYNKPFEIIYHFHGHDGKISKSLTDSNYGLKDQIQEMAKNKNIIIVVPQGPPKSLDYTWMNGKNNEDMQQFENDTLDIIKKQLAPGVSIAGVTVKGHSAGGIPIKNAAAEGKLKADRVDFLDASYGNWASSAYNNIIKQNPDIKFNVIYRPNSQTQADALSLQGKKGVSLIKANVDHSSVPKTFYSLP